MSESHINESALQYTPGYMAYIEHMYVLMYVQITSSVQGVTKQILATNTSTRNKFCVSVSKTLENHISINSLERKWVCCCKGLERDV